MTAPCLLLLFSAGVLAREHVAPSVPLHKFSQTLLASADLDQKSYLMVPISMRVGPDEVLVGLKRGDAHARDREAFFEIYSYQPSTGRLQPPHAAIGEPLYNYYNGQFVRHGNGIIDCFVDVQQGGDVDRVIRLGLRVASSKDGGKTFSPPRRVGPIDGVEYGYVFDSVVRGGRTFMLAMRFTNLAGGRVVDERWPHAGSVDVLVSDDNGGSWRFVRDLSAEFGGIPINESTLIPYGEGWLVACRGYDDRQWLARTDAEFRQVARRNLTADFDCIDSYLGRPRLYQRDGHYYLVGRNWTPPAAGLPAPRAAAPGTPRSSVARAPSREPMQLGWFRIAPETLAVETCVILDNAARHHVVDGYYATAHWVERDRTVFLNILTHKRADYTPDHRARGFHNPDLIRLEFVWDEIK